MRPTTLMMGRGVGGSPGGMAPSVIHVSPAPVQPHITWKVESPSPPRHPPSPHGYMLQQALTNPEV